MATKKEQLPERYFNQDAVHIPASIISALKREFDVKQEDLNNFVTCLIERRINEHIAENNSKIFSESEVKEIEDDLKGLGYI
jgi:hypothetical protein